MLHAALLDEHGLIKKVTLTSLISWADIVRRSLSRDQLASVVPGVSSRTTFPTWRPGSLRALLSILEPVDAMGAPVAQTGLETTYAGCVKAYGRRRDASNSAAAQGLTPSR